MSSNLVFNFGTMAVILNHVIANDMCNITYSNSTDIKCFPCKPGYIKTCAGNLGKCKECIEGTHQPYCTAFKETASCRNCLVCVVYKENCTIFQDDVCDFSENETRSDSASSVIGGTILIIPFVIIFASVLLIVVIFFKQRKRSEPLEYIDTQLETLDGYDNDVNTLSEQTVNASKDQLNLHSEVKSDENESKNTTENQKISLRQLEKCSTELQVNWTKVFLQLARSLPPTPSEIFALNLLGNCENMPKNIHDTVSEIKLEARSEYTEGWIIHAYLKVFKKWLDNLGRKDATFEQIEDALSVTIQAKEHMDLVLSIKKNPPMKAKSPVLICLPSDRREQRVMAHHFSNSLQCVSLHGDELPGTCSSTREILVKSSQKHCYRSTHFPHCSSYSLNEIYYGQERHTSIQFNKTSAEAKRNFDVKNSTKRGRIKKIRKPLSKTQQYKRVMTERYIIENAKQNLLLDIMPIRQNDYDLYMDFVIDLISKECHVRKGIVLSITYEGFCGAREVDSEESNSVFVIRGSDANLCVSKEVFDDLAIYGKKARSKLLTYLKANNNGDDYTVSEEFLFLTFQGKPLHIKYSDKRSVNKIAPKKMFSEQHSQDIHPLIATSPEVYSCKVMNNNTCTNHNSSIQSCHAQGNKEDVCAYNESHKDDFTGNEVERAISKIAAMDKEPEMKAERENKMVKNNRAENEYQEPCSWDVDTEIEREQLENIKASFFPTGEETYKIDNTDNISEILEIFVD